MAKIEDVIIAQKMVNKRSNATSRGLKYAISFKRMKQLMKQKTCFYTGVEFEEYKALPDDQQPPNAMTIDRVDNSIGYTDDNVVACTKAFNMLKSNMTLEQIEQLYKGVKKVEARNDKKNPNRLKPVKLSKFIKSKPVVQ